MANIVAAGNVEIPAYLVLVDKGYDVRFDGRGTWTASKDGSTFSGDGPIEVLGVVSIFESRGEDWKASDQAIDEFLEKFPQG